MRRTLFLLLTQLILLSSGNSPEKISDFVVEGIRNCQQSINKCHNNQFFYSDVTQISPSWFAFATTIAIPPPSPAPGWQGAIVYKKPTSVEEIDTGDHMQGLYVYPDWSSCVEGVWERHTLIQGYHCKIEETDTVDGEIKITKTSRFRDAPISYSPPNFYSFGVSPNLTDPFEKSTVYVGPSSVQGAGQGLFLRRRVRAGHLVSFFSGLVLNCVLGASRSVFNRRLEEEEEKHERNKNSLYFSDMVNPGRKFDICVFVPPEFSDLDQYSATLGHKANHRLVPNIRFTLFSAHPVLGSIMALVALEDLEPGQEVFGEYGYCDQTVYRDFT